MSASKFFSDNEQQQDVKQTGYSKVICITLHKIVGNRAGTAICVSLFVIILSGGSLNRLRRKLSRTKINFFLICAWPDSALLYNKLQVFLDHSPIEGLKDGSRRYFIPTSSLRTRSHTVPFFWGVAIFSSGYYWVVPKRKKQLF